MIKKLFLISFLISSNCHSMIFTSTSFDNMQKSDIVKTIENYEGLKIQDNKDSTIFEFKNNPDKIIWIKTSYNNENKFKSIMIGYGYDKDSYFPIRKKLYSLYGKPQDGKKFLNENYYLNTYWGLAENKKLTYNGNITFSDLDPILRNLGQHGASMYLQYEIL